MTHSLFVSIAAFLRVSPACVRNFCFNNITFVLSKCKLLWLRNYNIINEMTYVILLWTSVSLLTLAAGAFPSFTARNLSAVGLAFPDLYAGRAATSEDRCTPNQALPYHKIKGFPSVQRVTGLLKNFVTPGCFYSFFKLYFSLYLLKRHFLHFCCKEIYASQPLFANVVFLLQAAIMFATYYDLFTC